MADEAKSIFDADVLDRVAHLQIKAMELVEGVLTGQHRSRHKGSSVEFAEYKDYSPGDELRHIDWKVYGKTDKYQVKQFEHSTNLKCTLLLDASGSMGYTSPFREAPGHSKINYARTLTAALAYLLIRQSDAVGLILFNDKVLHRVPPRSRPSHFRHIVYGLETLMPRGPTRATAVIRGIVEQLPPRSMLILVSDFLEQSESFEREIRLLHARGIEITLFHILHPDEVRLPFEGDTIFESLEDEPEVGADADEIRESYCRLLQESIAARRRNFESMGIDYVFLETSTPLNQALSYYLLRRNQLVRNTKGSGG